MVQSERALDYRDPEWLAEQLGVDKSTIYRYLQEGTIPAVQLGRKWLVSERQVVDFLDTEASLQTAIRRKGMARPGFNKYTERAKRALIEAQQEAIALHHNYIGTEHLVLGITAVTESLAAFVLRNLGAEADPIRDAVRQIVGEGDSSQTVTELGLTPRAKKSLELAAEEAKRLGHGYIGTEHMLLGVLLEGEGVASSILQSLGIGIEEARQEIRRLLSAGNQPEQWAAASNQDSQ